MQKPNASLPRIYFSDINGVLICYKTSAIPIRSPPPIPQIPNVVIGSVGNISNGSSEVEKALNRLNLSGGAANRNGPPNQPVSMHAHTFICICICIYKRFDLFLQPLFNSLTATACA